MEESTEGSILPVIMIAIFLLIIIGIVVWVVLSRRVVGPPVVPIPLAPITPPSNNTSNVATPPTSVPVVRVTECKSKICDSSSTSEESNNTGSHSKSDSKSHTTSHSGSDSDASDSSDCSSRDRCCIQVYQHNMSLEREIDAPTEDVISMAHSSGKLYAATHSAIYVRNDGEWEHLGSVEEPIVELLDSCDDLVVRTEAGDYILTQADGKTKMNRCKTKQRLYQGERVRLDEGTLILGRYTLGRDVDCFHVREEQMLVYTSKGRLHRSGDGTKNKQYVSKSSSKLEQVRALCACDKYIYALVGDEARMSGSGNVTETE